jgi:hypothetical protein
MATPNLRRSPIADAIAAIVPAPAPTPAPRPGRIELDWEGLDIETLPADLRDAYLAIGKARHAFETLFSSRVPAPAGLKWAIAYKRGLAVALAPVAKSSSGLDFATFAKSMRD